MSIIKCLLLPKPWYWYSSNGFTRITDQPYRTSELNLYPIVAINESSYKLLVYSRSSRAGWFIDVGKLKFPTTKDAMLWVETMIATGAAHNGTAMGEGEH